MLTKNQTIAEMIFHHHGWATGEYPEGPVKMEERFFAQKSSNGKLRVVLGKTPGDALYRLLYEVRGTLS